MKKLISFLGAYLLYFLGEIFAYLSRGFHKIDWIYKTYVWLMINSCKIQDWGDLNHPWKEVNGK